MELVSEFFYCKVLQPYNLIFTKFLRPVVHEEFKQAMLAVYTSIQELKLTKWVMISTISEFTIPDQKWAVEQLGVLLYDTTLEKIAMVRNHDQELQAIAESIRTKVYRIYGNSKEMQHFATLNEAIKYLEPDSETEKLVTKLMITKGV
ncbi:hypothetical protein [Pontibacter sp. H249]|uniref:hypothetical protein n=1 Tax=Pontibacter sp. H249 TaxID=3133420 RepID=UPI0030C07F33